MSSKFSRDGPEVEFRPATEADLELLLAWRNHPRLYENFYQQEGLIPWDDHVEWWESRSHRRDWVITVNSGNRWRDVGAVNLSDLETRIPEVGVWIGEIPLWGNGVGSEAVRFSVRWVDDHEREYDAVRARILDHNKKSQALFEDAEFDYVGDAREDELEYKYFL